MINVPQLRFPEFQDAYKEHKLSELLSRYSENNKDEEYGIDDILSLSYEHGIVDRKELLEDTYSKVNHKNYIKTRFNDFIFGKSISTNYPYGLFKVNNFRDGLLSSLYFTFKTSENVSPTYLDKYFSHQNRANNFLKKLVLVGDRYITADSKYILSAKIFVPLKNEQEKVASFLTIIETKIKQFTKKEELLQQYKKGVMQKIFNQKIRFKKDDGSEFPEWQKKSIGEVFKQRIEKNAENLELLSVTMRDGVKKREDISTKNNSSENKNNYLRVYKNDIVYNSMRMWQGASGVSHYNGIVSPAYTVLKGNDENSSLFFAYYFKIQKNIHIFQRNSQGLTSDTWNLKYPQLAKIKLTCPHKDEQIKIADFLSSIDSKIEKVQNQLQLTKEFKKGLLQRMFV
ncbi:restriction endonuclease subunit S [Malaciobacter pacificus]|uniref:Type I restriction/modification system, specificity subunit n=1 Tax=Malaciobacter pacificus TaxID=1080223 RepID=A0A5C2H686_9BACT|nr:restriction endonuclease subunit S [Malaciobacter pacificus]QEP34470.1 type I restriction/modification system, specificity subunit [Malaciobacter pacificus]GGD34275.1 restriction endonuclease subunit S [Malaciobacter pacificus]